MWLKAFLGMILFSNFAFATQNLTDGLGIFPKQQYEGASNSEYLGDLRLLYFSGAILDKVFGVTVAKYSTRNEIDNASDSFSKAIDDYVKSRDEANEARRLAENKRQVLFILIGFVVLIIGFYTLKKITPIIKRSIIKRRRELKENISQFQEKIDEKRIKRKFEDAVVEETVKQQIKENTRFEEEIDKAIINEVVKREVEGNSSIDLTKLKQDIAVALKDGEYDKVKELTDLAEKINKLK